MADANASVRAYLVHNLAWDCSARQVDPVAGAQNQHPEKLPRPSRFAGVKTKQVFTVSLLCFCLERKPPVSRSSILSSLLHLKRTPSVFYLLTVSFNSIHVNYSQKDLKIFIDCLRSSHNIFLFD
jgi:hypothetical protein